MTVKSIKLKLFFCFLFIFSIISLGFDIYLYMHQKEEALESVDKFLMSKAHVFSGLIEVYEDGEIEFEPAEKKIGFERSSTIYDILHSGHYYQIFFDDGSLLASSASLGGFTLPFSMDKAFEKGSFETIKGPGGESLRIFTQKITITIRQNDYTFFIQAAETLEEVYGFLSSLKRLMLLSIPVTLLLSGLGGLFVAWFSLKPLRRFSAEVGNITEKNLDKRIDINELDTELKNLAGAFNTTLNNLERAFKQQKRLISDVSHELRTPASVIKSSCEIHLRREREAGEYIKALEIIMKNAGRMEKMIERLLVLSRYEERKQTMKMKNIPVKEVVEKSTSLLRPLADRNKVAINVGPVADDLFMEGDMGSMIEALINLVDNAIKYNNEGGNIRLAVEDSAGDIIIRVEDNGIGIPEGDIPSIFGSFYRVDRSRTNGEDSGAGLGLNIVKVIVEKHGGRIDVSSKVGKGTVFSLYFPKINRL